MRRAGAGRPAPRQVRHAGGGEEAAMRELLAFVERHLLAPRPIARLVVVRIFASLAILGFLSSRIVHADDWLSVAGFRLPDVTDWRMPLSVPGLPVWAAWTVGAAIAV